MANTREIYEKYCDGEKLSNDEVSEGFKLYTEAHDALIKLGPAFVVSRKECGRVAEGLYNMGISRGILK